MRGCLLPVHSWEGERQEKAAGPEGGVPADQHRVLVLGQPAQGGQAAGEEGRPPDKPPRITHLKCEQALPHTASSLKTHNILMSHLYCSVFNRPGVAGAVLHTSS